MFKKPFSFNGRIGRAEYGLSYLIYIIPAGLFEIALVEVGLVSFFAVLLVPLFWFLIAQGSKRCHDRGNSAWYQLIPFYIFWMLFADSIETPNAYGPSPNEMAGYKRMDGIESFLVKKEVNHQ